MCKISNNLKLCTCKTKDVQSLKHYWTLNRPYYSGPEILGEIIAPADISPETELHNRETLTSLLNGGNCFDVDMKHRKKDVLELHFSCQNSYLVYAFEFSDQKWETTQYDPFGNDLEEKLAGKIIKPFLS